MSEIYEAICDRIYVYTFIVKFSLPTIKIKLALFPGKERMAFNLPLIPLSRWHTSFLIEGIFDVIEMNGI